MSSMPNVSRRPLARHGAPVLAGALAMLLAAASAASAVQGDCGQPLSNGAGPTASDCGYVLKAAVGAIVCEMCICDVNGSESISTSDALVCLKAAVGQNVNLNCPGCGDGTTSTTDPGAAPSTTSTSTTSTTTTMPVQCSSNSQCTTLGTGFRCNPNTDTCEKPCSRTTDCHLFYVCNTTTKYCEEPALMF
ncbi:MAG: hypothetical protein ABR538_13085 [Candidatus Binatia bacterium]